MIRTLEEISLNALPALQTALHDGWVIRFANGYSRRANSINPLYPVCGDVSANIHACEQMYAQRGLPTIFKLTPAAQPEGLDSRLAELGYMVDAPTSVQTLDLGRVPAADTPAHLSPSFTDEWFAAYCQLGGTESRHGPTLAQMLRNLVPQAVYALITQGGEPVACGLGVLQAGYLGFYDIVTAAQVRGRGLGEQVMRGLLAWGKQAGAHTGYLQVMLNNEPALRLYAKLGFKESHQYWYRQKS
jgi:ribosomal protein S18 acetylase RimI-like enzyme